MDCVLGLDIWTTGCKATVFERTGAILMQEYREYPKQQYDGLISPDMIWEMSAQVIRACAAAYPGIRAICAASFGETVVMVDGEGKAFPQAYLYTNAEEVRPQWERLNRAVGEDRIYELTGYITHPMYTVSRLMWLKEKQPQQCRDTQVFLFVSDYINYMLCGAQAAEDTQAARSMMLDITTGTWCEEIIEAAGLDVGKLPEIVQAGTVLGTVRESVCDQLGLSKDTLVLAGGQDQPCAALGLGALQQGDAAFSLGTVECMSMVLDTPVRSPLMQRYNYVCSPHVIPGKYMTYAVLYAAGAFIRDIREKYYTLEQHFAKQEGRDIYPLMMQEAAQAAGDTGLYVLPHPEGTGTPELDTKAAAAIYGLRLSTTRGQILRAALEGLAFDMRKNLECLEECGLKVSHIAAAGGGTKSQDAMQIRVNAMGKELALPADPQAGTRGVFLIAAKSLGWIRDYADLPCEMRQVIRPEGDGAAAAEKYRHYQVINLG